MYFFSHLGIGLINGLSYQRILIWFLSAQKFLMFSQLLKERTKTKLMVKLEWDDKDQSKSLKCFCFAIQLFEKCLPIKENTGLFWDSGQNVASHAVLKQLCNPYINKNSKYHENSLPIPYHKSNEETFYPPFFLIHIEN